MGESQSYSRGILDHVADAVVTIGARGHIESFNPAAVAMFGYAPEEVMGKNVSMLMPEPDRSGHDGYLASYLDTGVGKILGIGAREVTARRKDGGVFPMELTVGVMTVDAKSVFIGAMRDLTRRKKAEAALRRTEDRLHDAIESIPGGFSLYDSDDRLVMCNQRYKDLYPRHASALVPGSSFADMLRVGVERGEFADAVGHEEEWIAERLGSHLDPQGPIEQRLGDGRWLRVEERRTREGGIVGLRTDITALKVAEAAVRESEQRFRDFAESASDWLWETDAEFRFTYVSPNVERITGVKPEWYDGKTRADVLGADYDRGRWAALLRAERERKPFRDFTYLRVGEGIEPRWINTSGVPVFAEDGAFLGYRGTGRDVTEARRAEEQIHHAQKMEAVGQLTGGLAHDFNNLLTVVLGNMEILLDHVGDDPVTRELVEDAATASERGASLTRRLLAFSRKQTLKPEAIDIDKLLFGTTELMRRTLGAEIEIDVVLAGGLWRAMVDQKQLENAIINLAINARDAMPGGGRLTIEAANADLDRTSADEHGEMADGRYVVIAVRDTGTGMPPDVVDRAFDPFFTTKEVGEGSGLGLSMVFGFAKQSGGHAAIHSAVGEGTTVRIYLPKAEAGGGTDPVEARSKAPPPPRGSERLLVVEDDDAVRSFLVNALRSAGYGVVGAANGEEALARLGDNPGIDLLITDVVLPGGMNGREVAAAVEALRPRVKTLFTSGYPRNAITGGGKLDAGVELLTKPYTRETLVRRVRQVLDADPLA